MKANKLISRRSCELYWGEAWLALWRALEARGLATELIKVQKSRSAIRLLDAGSGDGRFYDLLSFAVNKLSGESLNSTIQAFGLEKGRNRSAGMRRRNSPLTPIRGDITMLPFDDEVMDVVLCNSTLEHIEDMESALHEFARVLRPGGHLLFTVPSINFEEMLLRYRLFSSIRKTTAVRFAKAKSKRLSHLHYLPPAIWEQHLTNCLFPVVSWRSIVPSAVVAWGDVLQILRDFGVGGGHKSLRMSSARISDIPFRILKWLCIEGEHLIARLTGCLLERDIGEGVGGAYVIVAQRSSEETASEVVRATRIHDTQRVSPLMIATNTSTPNVQQYTSHP